MVLSEAGNLQSLDTTTTTTTQKPLGADSGLAGVWRVTGRAGTTVENESLTDVVAALVSALLALTFLLLLVCVVRVIKKRRRQRQGQQLNQPVVHTISPTTFAATTAAYSQHVPTAGRITWERVDTARRSQPSPPDSASQSHSFQSLDPAAHLSPRSRDLHLLPGPSGAMYPPPPRAPPTTSSVPSNSRTRSATTECGGGTLKASAAAGATPMWSAPQSPPAAAASSLAPPSSMQVIQVDAVLHHIPPHRNHTAEASSGLPRSRAHVTTMTTAATVQEEDAAPFPSLPPPLFGSSFQQVQLPMMLVGGESQDLTGTDDDLLLGATGGVGVSSDVQLFRSNVRTSGHQHRPSQS